MNADSSPHKALPAAARRSRLLEVITVFLRLGFTAYGGPAAHISFMQDEVVRRRKWLDDQQFLDLLGATNLIPGPNSTEMAIHLGFLRAGWPGLILGGVSFILPAMLIVIGLAWAYQNFGTTPQVGWLFAGIKPVVIAIILQALILLGRKAVKDWLTGVIGIAVLTLYLLGVNELVLLFSGGILVMIVRNYQKIIHSKVPFQALAPLFSINLPGFAAFPFSLGALFLVFLKIGAILYGSGYVLIAFLRTDFVVRLGWLTEQQLLDAVAVGQITPGPLFTTATFIGYQLGGLSGAVLSTLAIFLPGFVFVALSNPYIPKMRASPWLGAILDGVNISALGLMAGVTGQISQTVLVNPVSIGVAVIAAIVIFRWKVNTTWLILAGAVIGIVVGLIK